MRIALKALAFMGFAAFAAPTSAATLTTTSHTAYCSCFYSNTPALGSFDSSLGTLIGITLQVSSQIQYAAFVSNLMAPYPVTGTIDVSADGPSGVFINGLQYNFDVAGSKHLEFVDLTTQPSGNFDLFASGSATFVLDPSTFSSFVDKVNNCGGSGGLVGICGFGFGAPAVTRTMSPGLNWSLLDFEVTSDLTLTYTYNLPGEVPEPASWAMMLLGFGAIGFAVRGQKNVNGQLAPS